MHTCHHFHDLMNVRICFDIGKSPAKGLEVQVHHLISLGGWNDVKFIYHGLYPTCQLLPELQPCRRLFSQPHSGYVYVSIARNIYGMRRLPKNHS